MRGEYTYFAETGVWYGGSPPHTWGARLRMLAKAPNVRITPHIRGEHRRNVAE